MSMSGIRRAGVSCASGAPRFLNVASSTVRLPIHAPGYPCVISSSLPVLRFQLRRIQYLLEGLLDIGRVIGNWEGNWESKWEGNWNLLM